MNCFAHKETIQGMVVCGRSCPLLRRLIGVTKMFEFGSIKSDDRDLQVATMSQKPLHAVSKHHQRRGPVEQRKLDSGSLLFECKLKAILDQMNEHHLNCIDIRAICTQREFKTRSKKPQGSPLAFLKSIWTISVDELTVMQTDVASIAFVLAFRPGNKYWL
jgi:hypothetical protein